MSGILTSKPFDIIKVNGDNVSINGANVSVTQYLDLETLTITDSMDTAEAVDLIRTLIDDKIYRIRSLQRNADEFNLPIEYRCLADELAKINRLKVWMDDNL